MASVERLSLSLSLRLLHSESEKGERNGTEKRRFFVSATSAADSSPSFSLSRERVCLCSTRSCFRRFTDVLLESPRKRGEIRKQKKKESFFLAQVLQTQPSFCVAEDRKG